MCSELVGRAVVLLADKFLKILATYTRTLVHIVSLKDGTKRREKSDALLS